MLRKSTLAMAVALALAPVAGYGLGLGEIRSSSLMGHVFEGAIELTDVAADEVPNIKARLAPAEAFRKAGVDYSSAVRRLRFKPFVQPNGRPAIRVTSAEAVREPYLDFLIEVEWSQGRTVKEFTVLLDPPTFTERRAPQVQAPVAGPREAPPTPVPSARAAPASQPSTAAAARPPSLPPLPAEGPDYGPVKQGETLWRIADRNRAAGVSAEQTMIAILQANPDAFIGGNINRLKAGARLKLPTVQQYATLDPLDARDTYLRQMGRPVPARPAARVPAPLPVAATEAPAGDRVRLVTPSPVAPAPAQEAPAQAATPAAAPDLRQDVLLAHEKAESARQTADQLQGRVSDLETQLRDMQRLLVLKDTQLAQLQQKAEEATRAAAAAAAAVAVAAPSAPPAAAKSPTPAVDAQAEPIAPAAVVPAATPAEPPAVATTTPAEPAVAAAPVPEAKPAEPPPAAVTPAEPAAAPPPVALEPTPAAPTAPPVPEPAPEPKPVQPAGLASLLSDPANVLGAGIAGLGVLGALLWAIVGRRRSPATAEPAGGDAAVAAVPAEPAPVLTGTAMPVPAVPVTAVAAAAAAPTPVEGERVATEDLAALEVSTSDLFGLKGETTEVDPTEEADVYIAYGRYEQAEQLLRLALEMEPGRLALQHKLLEVYAASRDAPAFGALFAKLQAAGKAAEDPAAWQQALRMGSQIDPTNPLYGGVGAASAPGSGDALGKAREELAADLDRVAGKGADFGDLTFKSPAGESGLDDIDTGSVLNDLSLDLGTEDTTTSKSSSHPFNLDVAEDLKGVGGVAGIGEIDASEALAWSLDKSDATGLVETEIKPVEVTAEQLDDAAQEVPDLGDLEIGPDTALEMGDETTLMHADTTLELVDDVETKLDLARAYIELGDQDSARLMLEEAMQEGNAAQQASAAALLKELA